MLAIMPLSELEYNGIERRSKRSLKMRDILTSSLQLQRACCSNLWVMLKLFFSSSSNSWLSNNSPSLNLRYSRFSSTSFNGVPFWFLKWLHPSQPHSRFFSLLIYLRISYIYYLTLFSYIHVIYLSFGWFWQQIIFAIICFYFSLHSYP